MLINGGFTMLGDEHCCTCFSKCILSESLNKSRNISKNQTNNWFSRPIFVRVSNIGSHVVRMFSLGRVEFLQLAGKWTLNENPTRMSQAVTWSINPFSKKRLVSSFGVSVVSSIRLSLMWGECHPGGINIYDCCRFLGLLTTSSSETPGTWNINV